MKISICNVVSQWQPDCETCGYPFDDDDKAYCFRDEKTGEIEEGVFCSKDCAMKSKKQEVTQ